MVKNCDLGLENAALGRYFQDRGHSFSPNGPPSRQITYIYQHLTYFLRSIYATTKTYHMKTLSLKYEIIDTVHE